jgi:hypothetical protein
MILRKAILKQIEAHGKKWTIMFSPKALRPCTKSNSLEPGCGIVKARCKDGVEYQWLFDACGYLEIAPKQQFDNEAEAVVRYVMTEAMAGR